MPDYFTLAELRALPDVSDDAEYSDDAVEEAAAYIVGIIEREVETSFVARTITDEPHDGSSLQVILDSTYVLSVTGVTEDGVVVVDSLTARGGVLRRTSGPAVMPWSSGYGNILVTYEAGYSATPPADIKGAALRATRLHLLASAENSSANARRTSSSTELGVENFVVAGTDRPTGYPDVDATIVGWRNRLHVASVA